MAVLPVTPVLLPPSSKKTAAYRRFHAWGRSFVCLQVPKDTRESLVRQIVEGRIRAPVQWPRPILPSAERWHPLVTLEDDPVTGEPRVLGAYRPVRGAQRWIRPVLRRTLRGRPGAVEWRAAFGCHVQPSERLRELLHLHHPNVLPILDFEDAPGEGGGGLYVYSPWCDGGHLGLGPPTALQRFGYAGVLHLLGGAFAGLDALNDGGGWLHGSVAPESVGVRLSAHGPPVAVLLGAERCMRVALLTAADRHHRRSQHYGAPFRHDDVRRDQAAMLLVALGALTGQPFPGYPGGRLLPQAPNFDEEHQRWVREAVAVPPALRSRFALLATGLRDWRNLVEADDGVLEQGWGSYTDAHRAIVDGLRAGELTVNQ